MGDTKHGLDDLFTPSRVAVVGASDRPGTMGAVLMGNLAAFPGETVPVSTSREMVAGTQAYPSLRDVPGRVDLAVVAVAAAQVPEVLADAAAAGVGVAVVLAGGFAETGPEGAALQERAAAAARGGGVRLVGPNCFGVQNPNAGLNASMATGTPSAGGDIALATQSGAYGMAIFTLALEDQLRFSKVYSAGNKADVTDAEVLAFFGDSDDAVLCFFLESVAGGRDFVERARAVTPRKPVVVAKTGRTAAGARAALSHTAGLAGTHELWRSAFAQAGVVAVRSGVEMVDAAKLLDWQPAVSGPRVGIVSNSGGVGVELSDLLAEEGLEVPELSPALQARLADLLPAYGSAHNPVDLTPDWPRFAELYSGCLDLLARSGEVDAVVLALVQRAALDEPTATAVSSAAAKLRNGGAAVPITVCWLAPADAQANIATLQHAGLPAYPAPERTARALAHGWQYADARRRVRPPPPRPPRPEGLPPLEPTMLHPTTAAAVADAFGVDVAPQVVCRDADEAVTAARAFGYPVVVKLVSEQVAHKSDVGGVRVGVATDAQVRAAVTDVASIDPASAVLVQPQLEGIEAFVGGYRDPNLGPLVALGLGGVLAEVLDDVAFRLAPVDQAEAGEAIRALRGFRVLAGARGQPAADLEALAATVASVSRLMAALPEVAELDANPVLATPQGAVAVDLRIVVDSPPVMAAEA